MLSTTSSTQKSTFKIITQAALLSFDLITSSIFVYAQTEESKGFTVNGVFILESDVLPYDRMGGEIPQPIIDRWLVAMESAYAELPQKSDESIEEYTLRHVREYLRTQMIVTGLEEYAAGYEQAYDSLESEKESLEERIAVLEQENARLVEQN